MHSETFLKKQLSSLCLPLHPFFLRLFHPRFRLGFLLLVPLLHARKRRRSELPLSGDRFSNESFVVKGAKTAAAQANEEQKEEEEEVEEEKRERREGAHALSPTSACKSFVKNRRVRFHVFETRLEESRVTLGSWRNFPRGLTSQRKASEKKKSPERPRARKTHVGVFLQ
ncbi:hypothetical protein TGRH88_006330 [Toxoplasma gondii]|uniref:Uncharacterized protein n=1 Tax=Toxoplasma gondii TaxID=5811 RepID=A0A7J6KEN9_TOXGO|nr:hypothetical protein TGRH88_006330 [Toxoplasma gondii]